jgi:endonuclease YncB( thermonuclease family)
MINSLRATPLSGACIVLALLASVAASAADLAGRVVDVTDGDTLTLLDASKKQQKIRLAGIDAPALKQPFGEQAKKNLSDLLNNRQVTVEWDKLDRSKRIIGKVFFQPELCASPACLEKTDANYQQIAAGMAWLDKPTESALSPVDRDRYAAAEKQARAAKRGLWSDPAPVPPWEWRPAKKTRQ